MKVYLAGPISGTSYDECTSWRDYATEFLKVRGLTGLSPMRGKAYLKREAVIFHSYAETLSTPKGITERDRFDCLRADAVLINLLGARTVSIGTVMEIGWANAKRTPIVVAMEPSGNPHEHPMVREACSFILPTLDEALHTVAMVLVG